MTRRLAGRDPREIATYDIAEAAHYLHLPASTLRSWVRGQDGFERIIVPASPSSPMLSFINLVEAHVLAAIRREHHIPMGKVRAALKNIRKIVPLSHPLASHRFETDGMDLFVRSLGELINLSQPKQRVMREILDAHLKRIEWDEEDRPRALFPFITSQLDGRRSVMVNPRVAFGRLVIAGTGIPTLMVAQRYQEGESIDELAEDYGRDRIEIEDAVRCELQLAA